MDTAVRASLRWRSTLRFEPVPRSLFFAWTLDFVNRASANASVGVEHAAWTVQGDPNLGVTLDATNDEGGHRWGR